MQDFMVDLETLDTRPSGAIISIGACAINWDGGEPTHEFYRVIDADSCAAAGLTTSKETLRWWSQQGEEARKVFTDPNVSILQALVDFADYLRPFGHHKVRIWGNGSDFDNVMLINAYNALGLDAPWRFYNNRCFRTVRDSLKHHLVDVKRAGTHHNALDDAKYQARILSQLAPHLNPAYVGLALAPAS